ncbi:MAG TPA: STAS domain-containing protein [Jatrophihabitantaceae bacterium]
MIHDGLGQGSVHVELSVTQQSVGGYPVLGVRGEVDVYSAPNLKGQLSAMLPASPTVVVDLSDVAFLDSTGLGALVAARTSAVEAGGNIPLVCPRERILKLFKITGLDQVFQIYPSVDEAVAALSTNR